MSTDYDGRVVRIDLLPPKSKSDGVGRAFLVERAATFVVGDDGSTTPLE